MNKYIACFFLLFILSSCSNEDEYRKALIENNELLEERIEKKIILFENFKQINPLCGENAYNDALVIDSMRLIIYDASIQTISSIINSLHHNLSTDSVVSCQYEDLKSKVDSKEDSVIIYNSYLLFEIKYLSILHNKLSRPEDSIGKLKVNIQKIAPDKYSIYLHSIYTQSVDSLKITYPENITLKPNSPSLHIRFSSAEPIDTIRGYLLRKRCIGYPDTIEFENVVY